jgi:hypothetical protein
MTYYVTTPEDLTLLSTAANLLAGLTEPVRGVVHGGPDSLPTEFAGPGTPGWTDTLFRGSWVSADQTMAGVEVTPDMLRFAGQSVMVGDVLVTMPTEAEGVEELPPELLEENGAFWWEGDTGQTPEEQPPEEPPP